MDNRQIAERLDAFASLLELGDANPYTARAYRRAAETIRAAAVPVAELARSGRARELRGIGAGIESRLRELAETGEIAELAELERELAPDLVGLGRYLGLSAKRSVELARALGVRTAEELREAATTGRLQTVPGIGPKTEARLIEALSREADPRPPRGLLLSQAWELVAGIASALDGEAAGDVRRWRDSCERLAVVCAALDPRTVLERFAALPQIVAVVEQSERRALGVTVEGVPVELVAAEPNRFGTALMRATGAPAYVAALSRCRMRPTSRRSTARSACPGARRSCASSRSAMSRRRSSSPPTSAATCTATRPGRTGGLASKRWAAPPRSAATTTWRSATTRPPWARCAGSAPEMYAARLTRSRPPTSSSRHSGYSAGSSATSSPTAASICPTKCSRSSTGCRRVCMAASECRDRS